VIYRFYHAASLVGARGRAGLFADLDMTENLCLSSARYCWGIGRASFMHRPYPTTSRLCMQTILV
jgi:hypothetical protein